MVSPYESSRKERFEVVPHVSSMQLAFARVKESWDDAYLTNLATQSLDRVVDTIRTAERVGLFTTESIYPVACELLAAADPGDRPIRLIGVSASGLHDQPPDRQLGLFGESAHDESAERVANVMDEISERFGHDALKRAKLVRREEEEDGS